MEEEEIVARLQENIPKQPEHDMAAPVVSDPHETPIEQRLDETTLYKLHQHFGETYREGDLESNKQIGYIFETIAERLGTYDYPIVVSKINELKRMLGLNHTNNSKYKLYEWLKLDQKRSRIEMEMDNVRG